MTEQTWTAADAERMDDVAEAGLSDGLAPYSLAATMATDFPHLPAAKIRERVAIMAVLLGRL